MWYLQICIADGGAPFWDNYVHSECEVLDTKTTNPFTGIPSAV